MNSITSKKKISFLPNEGEMCQLIQQKDWHETAIGNPKTWPQSLRTTLSIILNSKFPMFLFWGPELICFYNDAYRPSLGNDGKHPAILGGRGEDFWQEIWSDIKPLIDNVLAGQPANWSEDQLLPIFRNNKMEDVYWTFSYSAVNDESGKPTGVFVTCSETTNKVIALKNLEESQEQLKFTISAASLGTWDLNPYSHVFIYNQQLKDWFGLIPENEVDAPIALSSIIEKDRKKTIDAMQAAMTRGSDGNYEMQHTVINPFTKQERILLAKGKALFDEHGDVYRFSGTGQDITEQVLAQRKLEESEKNFRMLSDQAPMWIWLTDDNINVLYANTEFLNFIGIPHYTEFTGKAWENIIHPDDISIVYESYRNGAARQESFTFECRIKNASTDAFEWIFFKVVARKEADKFAGFIGTGINIHRQKTQLFALEESEERFRMLAETLPALVWATDEKGNAEYASGKWEEYTGVQPLTAEDWASITHPDDIEGINKAFSHCLATGDTYKYDVRLKSRNQKYRWFTVSGVPLFDDNHNIVKWIGAFMDIHTEKSFSQELKTQVNERTKELSIAKDNLIHKNGELEKMNKELEAFAYVSSHDLQEPLRKIQTFASRILEKENENLSETGKDYLRRMRMAGERMQQLIQDLLAYSRTKTADRKFESIDLTLILEDIKEDLKDEFKQHKVIIETNDSCAIKVKVIPFQFRQLIYNLVSNSIKFAKSNEAPIIKLFCEISEGSEMDFERLIPNLTYYHLTISDNGIGFNSDYKEKIFEIFQRLHGREEYTGTGIGLAIVKKIIENHEGYITANGELGRGATFDIYIPTNL
jgi:PAS domain S-box-containing protein